MNPDQVRLSKRMSYILRHNPMDIDIELDDHGWVDLEVFITQLQTAGMAVDRADIIAIVRNNDKQRFELVDNRIRAAQGHSVDVQLGLDAVEPPDRLWHGTVNRFVTSILATGLQPSGRTHVHLSESIETAASVGSRRGTPVVLAVDAAAMHRDDHAFYRSANGVWLTKHVPPTYISTAPR